MIAGPTDSAPDGWEALTLLREQLKSPVPVICIVKKDDEGLIVTALNAGADDCMCMPLRSKEFLARVNAVTRRTQGVVAPAVEHLEMAALRIDMRNRLIFRDSKRLTLTPKTYDLAVLLLTHTGQLLSRSHLLERVWGRGRTTITRTLDTHISRLRTVLGLTPENGWKLQSVYQHGYRLDQIAISSVSSIAVGDQQYEAACAA